MSLSIDLGFKLSRTLIDPITMASVAGLSSAYREGLTVSVTVFFIDRRSILNYTQIDPIGHTEGHTDLMNWRHDHTTSVCVSTMVRSLCGLIACWTLAQTSLLITWSLFEIPSILR